MGIAMLGPLVVEGEGGRLGHRDRVVLAVLAVRAGSVVAADQLAAALWGDAPPATWSKVVQGCVVRLRKVLGSDAIETSRNGYRLTLPAGEIDSQRFERLLRRGRELLTLSEPERAAYVLGEAMALWRGPALSDLDGWDVGRIEAARLDELRRDAEELKVDAALRAGRCREVLGEAQSLVAQAPLRERRWALLALAKYQAGQQAEALRTLRQVRTVLTTELGLDPGPDLVALEEAILRQDPSLAAEVALPRPSLSCPYQGLLPYDVSDADTFYGREAEVLECRRRLVSNGVLVVVGPSGSGKSSLVRAGVAAALERDGHRMVVIEPGARPMDALTAVPASGPPPVLVVDQCEEAVTLCSDPAERARFFGGLAEHAERGLLVVALRADRMGEVSAYPAFARLVERGLFLLSAMEPDQLHACIEGPAHQAGVLLEAGLADLLVREVEGEAGAMPLLSHALRETWSKREGRTLTVTGYQATGGIRGAVARTAEQVYERAGPDQRQLVRDLMLRLVTPGIEGEPVRRRTPRRSLASDAPHEQVIEMLVDARLVTSDDGVLELAHEAVARAWPRLREWLDDDVEGQRILRHLTASADAWESMGRPSSELYRGVRLAQSMDWREDSRPDLTPRERDFLDASQAQVDAEISAARQQAELESRSRRRTRKLAVGLAIALIVALVAAAGATRFQQAAEERASEAARATTVADANRLAALSRSVGSLDLSLLLAAQATRTAHTPATLDGLLGTLVRHRRATQVVQLDRRPVDIELSDRGRTLFISTQVGVQAWETNTSSQVHDVVDWDNPEDIAASPRGDLAAMWSWKDDDTAAVGVFSADGTRRLQLEGADEIGGQPHTFGFSPDGRRLRMFVVNENGPGFRGTIREVDVATGRLVRTLPGIASADPDGYVWCSFADDGSTAVCSTLTDHPKAALVNLEDGSRSRLDDVDRPAVDEGFLALPRGVARVWSDGAITLYDRVGNLTQTLEAHQDLVNDVVVSSDGIWAASVDEQGAVVVWDVDRASGLWTQRESLVGHDGAVTSVAVHPDGQTLVTASNDRTAISWDMSAGAGFGSPFPGLGDRVISNRPQTVTPGALVVAPTRPQTADDEMGETVAAVFLDPRTGTVVDEVPVGDTALGTLFGSSVALSPDRAEVAVTYANGVVVLDTRTREELARIVLPGLAELGERHPEWIWCAAWTPDGSRLLLGAEGKEFDVHDGGLVVVDTSTWDVVANRVDLGGSAHTMETSPDGRWLAVSMTIPAVNNAPPGMIRILDARTLRLHRVLRLAQGEFPFDLSFSSDGKLLAAGGDPGTVSIFDVDSGTRLHRPAQVHNGFVQQVEWLPDNRTLVTTGLDGMVSLYDTERGLVRASMPGSSDGASGYTYLTSVTANEVTVVTGAGAGRVYSLTAGSWLAYACVVAGRNLTRDEWAAYLPGRPYERTCADRGHAGGVIG